jgi:YesN/AraC family two-component response regulator
MMNSSQEKSEKLSHQILPTGGNLGEAENIKEAVPLIAEKQPQLVFLDVEMPFGNAFDVLEATKEFSYETIFITAFSQYSFTGFK